MRLEGEERVRELEGRSEELGWRMQVTGGREGGAGE